MHRPRGAGGTIAAVRSASSPVTTVMNSLALLRYTSERSITRPSHPARPGGYPVTTASPWDGSFTLVGPVMRRDSFSRPRPS